jgi:uncharacterized surface protein with fasciclin (FAS1) repeats
MMRIGSRVIAGVAVAVASTMTACGPGATSAAAEAPRTTGLPGGVTTISDVFGPGCARLPSGDRPGSLSAMAGQDVAAAILTNPLLTDFAHAVRSDGQVSELNAQRGILHPQRGITVFAPDDGAFTTFRNTMGEDAFRSLVDNPRGLAALPHHDSIGQRLTRDELVAAGTATALDGDRLTVAPSGATITVAEVGAPAAHVVCGNIPTKNATVFIIDSVLISPQSQFAHVTPRDQVHCAPNPNAYDNAVLCFDTPH